MSGPDRRGQRRFGLLLVATLLALAVQGMAPASDVQQVVVSGLSGACLLLALRASELSQRLLAPAAGLAVIVFALTIVKVTAGGVSEGAARSMNAALIAFGPPAVAVGVVRSIRTSRQVRLEAVMGVLSLYVLIGMLWAFVYGALDRFGSDAFFAGGEPATVAHCLYFSFVTLTTVGYGDLTAQGDLGHTLAVFEALIGQIYMVTVVSVIVSNLGRPRPAPGG